MLALALQWELPQPAPAPPSRTRRPSRTQATGGGATCTRRAPPQGKSSSFTEGCIIPGRRVKSGAAAVRARTRQRSGGQSRRPGTSLAGRMLRAPARSKSDRPTLCFRLNYHSSLASIPLVSRLVLLVVLVAYTLADCGAGAAFGGEHMSSSASSDNFDEIFAKNTRSIALKVRPPDEQKLLDEAVLLSGSSSEDNDHMHHSSQDEPSFVQAPPQSASLPPSERRTPASAETIPFQQSAPHSDPSEAFFGADVLSDGSSYHADSDGSDDQAACARCAQRPSEAASAANAINAQYSSTDTARAPTRTADESIAHTDRGGYDRKNSTYRKKLSHVDQAAEHLLVIKNSGLGQPCGANCHNLGTCGDSITKNELYRCHEYSYGKTYQDKEGKWDTTIKTRGTQQKWREKMTSFASYDNANRARFKFVAAGRDVCEEFARAAYGITQFAWNTNMAALRKGPGKLDAKAGVIEWNRQAKEALKAEKATSMKEAIQWWMLIFPLWDAIPNEYIIKHPRLVWDRLFVSANLAPF
eukprot:4203868-Pleurochrysis_carterae.AAC.3